MATAKDISIRNACIDDLTALRQLYAYLDDVHSTALPDTFRPSVDITRPTHLIERFIADDNTLLLVATVNHAPVGLLQAEVRTANHPVLIRKDYGNVSDIVVHPTHRRTGIATRLMERAQAWFDGKDLNDVRLTVYNVNRDAVSFYRSLGFSALHTTMAYLHD